MDEEDLLANVPPEERAARRELGQAMIAFVRDVMGTSEALPPQFPGKPRPLEYDVPMLEHCVEKYRQAVEKAAAQGIEAALCWHTLAAWTDEGRERVGYFSRALDCLECDRDAHLRPATAEKRWSDMSLKAGCLYEIGRVHAYEGDPAVAQDFLMRALALVRDVEAARAEAGLKGEENLEGKIGELLVQLP